MEIPVENVWAMCVQPVVPYGTVPPDQATTCKQRENSKLQCAKFGKAIQIEFFLNIQVGITSIRLTQTPSNFRF